MENLSSKDKKVIAKIQVLVKLLSDEALNYIGNQWDEALVNSHVISTDEVFDLVKKGKNKKADEK